MKLSKLSARMAAPIAALVVAGLTATACAPESSDNSGGKDEKSGTLRVWLFQEVDTAPKEKVVDGVVAAFEKAHKGTKVDVQYIPVETRAEKIKAAFNDPKSAPDLIEYGNTDTAGYVKDGGLADVTKEFTDWSESKDTDPTAKQSVTVDGKVYGVPYFVGVRALYYRTDVFEELDLEVPKTQAELISTAKAIRQAKPELYGARGRRRLHVRRDAVHLVQRRRDSRGQGRLVCLDDRQRGVPEGHQGVHLSVR
ncbi:ABC-type glycerol-3-phosphate transport system substrate-binding protein [Streptomyces umbrinus]|uniref:ABC-type glycerol-3-phosphate transport system substrate-binding protein n=1 Tax=Streptomyces umbrinus TaxID=67370 RepID=A0ABU0T280_9ACTN|nr:ABC-type glycerol-3-phosphate transport system substrate-binding protein [Streptomyces umbrinus]